MWAILVQRPRCQLNVSRASCCLCVHSFTGSSGGAEGQRSRNFLALLHICSHAWGTRDRGNAKALLKAAVARVQAPSFWLLKDQCEERQSILLVHQLQKSSSAQEFSAQANNHNCQRREAGNQKLGMLGREQRASQTQASRRQGSHTQCSVRSAFRTTPDENFL